MRQEQRETLQLLGQTPIGTSEHEELKTKLRLSEDKLEDCICVYNLYMQPCDVDL